MILIGQFDSPFVRRVGVALELYALPYEHRPWSTWGNSEELAVHNPLRRVPTLLLDDGECLIESFAILDWLDEVVGPAKALLPAAGPARRRGLHVAALATGLADKAVSLFYERRLHPEASVKWVDRCRAQIGGVLTRLEADRAKCLGTYWFGDSLTHADIAVTCALRFLVEAHPDAGDLSAFPALSAHARRCESLAVFEKISQPFFVQT